MRYILGRLWDVVLVCAFLLWLAIMVDRLGVWFVVASFAIGLLARRYARRSEL